MVCDLFEFFVRMRRFWLTSDTICIKSLVYLNFYAKNLQVNLHFFEIKFSHPYHFVYLQLSKEFNGFSICTVFFNTNKMKRIIETFNYGARLTSS